MLDLCFFFFFSSRRRHTRFDCDWSSDVCSSDLDAVVKEFDAVQGKVTLAHGPVKSLGWPAMTMAFGVKDKALYDKLAVGAKVHVGFKKEGDGYVVTSVK